MKTSTTISFKTHARQTRAEWYHRLTDDNEDKTKDELFMLINLGIIN